MAINIFEVQKAVYTAINIPAVTAIAVGGIYDRVPMGITPTFPYITFGAHVSQINHNQCGRWDDVWFQIDVWTRDNSQRAGRSVAYDVQNKIRTALDNQKITITGARCMHVLEQSVTVLDDGDGLTWHGVQVFAIGVYPTS